MTTHSIDHHGAAMSALEAATIARQLMAAEYGKTTGRRDYDLIGELRAAARHNLAEAHVHATLHAADVAAAAGVVVVVDNVHDAEYAVRGLRRVPEPSIDYLGRPDAPEPCAEPGADRC